MARSQAIATNVLGSKLFFCEEGSKLLPPSENIRFWRVQMYQNIRSWKDRAKLNEVGE
jgi:hypothetical protein